MYFHFKHTLDTIFAALLLVILLVPFGLIAIWIKLDSRGPVLFKAKRVGRNKNVFEMYKFRTMRVGTPVLPPNKFENVGGYITRPGRILRKTSIDELPQLINVLRGEMSFIGPRPGAASNEDSLIRERSRLGVFNVRPGITGWAQVNGRDELAHDVKEKARADAVYVKNVCARMDIKCLAKTFNVVVLAKGYMEGCRATSNHYKKHMSATASSTTDHPLTDYVDEYNVARKAL